MTTPITVSLPLQSGSLIDESTVGEQGPSKPNTEARSRSTSSVIHSCPLQKVTTLILILHEQNEHSTSLSYRVTLRKE